MLLLVDCSSCRTPLHLPPGATRIRCSICHAFTLVAPEPHHQSHAPASPLPFSNSFTFPPPSSSLYPPVPSPSVYPPPTLSHSLSAPSAFSHVPSAPSPFSHAPPAPSPFNHFPPAQAPLSHSSFNHAHLAPSPYNHAPPGPPPPVHGEKRAVIVGVSYKDTENELKGCINDAKCMKFMLMKRFKFPESCILMLTEEEADPLRWPTRNNITMAMHWLVLSCKPGDSLVFHFSGHGNNQTDLNGDEVDGFDETLLPVDHATSGVIVDDEINATIVRPLPYGVKLHAIIDACHSGTVMDLPYLCRMESRPGKYEWEDHRPPSGMWKGTSGGEVFSFTGCDDDQTSVDTPQLSGSAWTGAMTYAFIQAIERGHGTTYGSLLSAMRSTVHEIFDTNKGRELVEVDSDFLNTLLGLLILGAAPSAGEEAPQKTQEPQLSANEAFDVYEKPFSL
ncbi:unnamed protein product [Brassica rapa]|uniref:Uncharacterized protein n=1 Tax=Brassica campestris TaxID=3711 RepID=A0A3P5ZRV3_BRACM|nr:unnamed protein product [Brassica rapa]VDC75090.1 unnamed protein product [Brassica rapa]